MKTFAVTRVGALLAAATALAACRQSAPTPAPAPAHVGSAVAVPGQITPILFSVSKPDVAGGKPLYLFGTIHLGVDAATQVPPWVFSHLDAATTFGMETNIMDPTLPAMLMRGDAKTLQDELGPATWAKLEAALGPDTAAMMLPMKASVPASLLSMKGLEQTAPMDMTLLTRAQGAGKTVVYLEEAAAQEAILEKWMDARALTAMLDDPASIEKGNRDLLAAYQRGDIDTIVAEADDRTDWHKQGRTDAEFDQQTQDMLYGRNAAWIPRLEQLVAGGNAFVAVGAMHLSGKGSVVDLLQRDGYVVTRVRQ